MFSVFFFASQILPDVAQVPNDFSQIRPFRTFCAGCPRTRAGGWSLRAAADGDSGGLPMVGNYHR